VLPIVAGGLACPALWLLLLAPWHLRAEDATYVYTVQVSAVVQTSPVPQITLNWEPDPYGATNYAIWRKAKDDPTWGSPIASLDGSALSYTDTNVAVGSAYEYQIIKSALLGYIGTGYIYSGINAPLTESRGTLLLVVATNATASLSNELARLQSDLIGDGWLVQRSDVSTNDTPESVHSVITNAFYADPLHVNTVFLFGHVPALQSGNLSYDDHQPTRAMPADAYYGDVTNDWPTDLAPTNDLSFLPSDVTLMVGRVDLFNMPSEGDEVSLLRNYLNKDHNWRTKLVTVPRQALMGNVDGDRNGEADAASGYRNFAPFVGLSNLTEADVESDNLDNERWISLAATHTYLWAYGCGGGSPDSIGGLGTNCAPGTTNPPCSYMYSTDVVGQDAKAVFVLFFGSWFAEWDDQDDLMRSVLATPSLGLTSCESGRPHWFCHHMGLGETIGYSTRLSMNNSTLYQTQSNKFARAVFISLMGDPTLRMDPVAPPGGLTATVQTNAVALTWSASADNVLGYHVCRASTPAGPFVRLTSSLVAGTNYTDSALPAGVYTYMIRAVALEVNPSGSYFDPSQGVFLTVTNPAITIVLGRSANGLKLSWNSSPGMSFHVLGASNLIQPNWSILSGSLTATNAITSWIDTNANGQAQRFYRVASP